MIDTIEVTINNKKYKYSKNITLQEIYIEHQEHNKYPILIARVNNRAFVFHLILQVFSSETIIFIQRRKNL